MSIRSTMKGGETNQNALAVAIIEDDPLLLAHFRDLIEAEPDMRFAGSAGSLKEGMELLEQIENGVLLCDLGLPDGDGIDIVRFAAEQRPALHVLVITIFSDNNHVFSAIEAGAVGYLLKDALPSQFADAIREVAGGGSPINPSIARHLLRSFQQHAPAAAPRPNAATRNSPLTARETEIIELTAKGLSFGDIAKMLSISTHTVTAHVRKIYQKLAVNSRGEAVYEARQMGIIR